MAAPCNMQKRTRCLCLNGQNSFWPLLMSIRLISEVVDLLCQAVNSNFQSHQMNLKVTNLTLSPSWKNFYLESIQFLCLRCLIDILFFMKEVLNDVCTDKTQCQLCKRLTWPIILSSWSSLVCKRVSPTNLIARGHSTITFLCIRPFSVWWQTTDQSTNQPGASLLLTSEKAVFCKIIPLHGECALWIWNDCHCRNALWPREKNRMMV